MRGFSWKWNSWQIRRMEKVLNDMMQKLVSLPQSSGKSGAGIRVEGEPRRGKQGCPGPTLSADPYGKKLPSTQRPPPVPKLR